MKKTILINIPKDNFNYPDIKKYQNKFTIVFNKLNKKINKKKIFAIIAGVEKFSKKEIDTYPNLRIISRFGTGTDNIDIDYANKKKIKILRTRVEPVLPTAELTIAFIFLILKKLYSNLNTLKKKKWFQYQGNNLRGRVVGIYGFGLIGSMVGNLLSNLGCKIYFYDTRDIKHGKFKQVSFNRLLKYSDIICIHANFTKDQYNVFNKYSLKKMKKNCIFLNTARGGFVDELALFNHLKRNKNFYAGFDCFKKEPYKGKLLDLPNFFATSHISSNTYESRKEMSKKSFLNVIKNFNL